VLLEWFIQKEALYIPIRGPMLGQKAEERALKLNSHLPMEGLTDSENMQSLSTEPRTSNPKA
jgi:hypothetical protein